ncbi:amidohydrolase 2, partial [Trematosphaeria pertusa]
TTPQAPFIAVLESYLAPAVPVGTSTSPSDAAFHLISTPILTKLKNVGPARVKDMRSTGVSMQVVSHVPIPTNPSTCAKLNDSLAAAICLSQDRFAALALLPMNDPKDAARELQRCVTKYQFVGGVLGLRRKYGIKEGEFSMHLDDPAFKELWGIAEKYRVPVALKEVFPSREQIPEYKDNYPDSFVGPLVTNFHAAHTSSPLPILRLYAAGVFQRHPNLRLILSQSAHSIASALPRIESVFSTLPTKTTRSFKDVWQHNLYVTTADDLASMRALLEHIPIDRVLYATNYPFEERGRGLMTELKESGLVGREEWERIAWGNAASLFGLKGDGARVGR